MSKRPQEFGHPPLKIRVEGEEGFKPAQRKRLEELSGEIARFHAGCLQQQQLSGQPSYKKIKSLPDGSQFRYYYNNGQETLDVRMSPKVGDESTTTTSTDYRPVDAVLAIDVLFDHHTYTAADINHYEEFVFSEGDPGVPGDPFPPQSSWTELFSPSDTPLFSPSSPASAGGGDPNGVYTGASNYYRALGVLDGYVGPYLTSEMGFALISGPLDISGPSVYDGATPMTVVYAAPVDWNGDGIADVFRVEFGWLVPGAVIPIPPTPPDIRKLHERDTHEHLNTLLVVGMQVGTLGEGGYAAVSTGDSGTGDGRLKCIDSNPSNLTASRELTFDDPEPNIVGCGFVARPRDSVDPVTEIDVYVESCNIIKQNSYPESENGSLDVDDPSFTYDVDKEVSWTIRAREFVDAGPVAVSISTSVEKRTQHFYPPDEEVFDESGSHFEPGYDVPPSLSDPAVVAPAVDRARTWAFAALSTWEDAGDNADPTDVETLQDPALGTLLVEASGTKTVAGPNPLKREFLDTPEWERPVTEMTKIATIRWVRPTGPGKGKATIELT